jgi:hypothetical protein
MSDDAMPRDSQVSGRFTLIATTRAIDPLCHRVVMLNSGAWHGP